MIDWIGSNRSFPGAKRFPKLAVIAMVEAGVERQGEAFVERRSYISSGALSAADFAAAVRSHCEIENRPHWMFDVTFKRRA